MKKIVAKVENDVSDVLWKKSHPEFYLPDREIWLLDLARDTSALAYNRVDRTDLVDPNGQVDHLIFGLAATIGDKMVQEYFPIRIAGLLRSKYEKDDENLTPSVVHACPIGNTKIDADTWAWGGEKSIIGRHMGDGKLYVTVKASSTLNYMTGVLTTTGETNVMFHPGTIHIDMKIMESLVPSFVAYSVDLCFDSEEVSSPENPITDYSAIDHLIPLLELDKLRFQLRTHRDPYQPEQVHMLVKRLEISEDDAVKLLTIILNRTSVLDKEIEDLIPLLPKAMEYVKSITPSFVKM